MQKKTERLEFRATPLFLEALDEWRRAQRAIPARGDAVRKLVEIGLSADAANQNQKKESA